jgi:hypothetical protein
VKHAYAEYRKQCPKTTGNAIVGGIDLGLGASFFIGIRGLGLGLRGGQHALEDTTLPFVGRLLQAGDELSKGWIWSGEVGAFSGKLAWEAIKQAFANDRKLTEAIGECKKKYPLAEHRIPFFTI